MTNTTISTLLATFVIAATGVASAQNFDRLVDRQPYGRYVDLKSRQCNGANYSVNTPYTAAAPVAPIGYGAPASPYYNDAYRASPYGYANGYGAAAYAPTIPIASRNIQAGGCYAPDYGNGGYGAPGYGTRPIAATSHGYPGQYPYWTANGRFRHDDEYIARNLFGAPTRFDRDEPVRNIFRWLLPLQ